MPTFTVILTDRRDDGHIDPESQLCAFTSLREALNRIRTYASQHTEANLTGVQIVQDGARPRLSSSSGIAYLVVGRLANEREDQSCPVILCATRELADQFIAGEQVRGGLGAALFAVQEMPLVTSLGVEAEAPPVSEADDAS